MSFYGAQPRKDATREKIIKIAIEDVAREPRQ